MGAKDIKSNEYLADNSRFADLFNYKLYDGESVIRAEDLRERSSTEILDIFGVDTQQVQAQKWRDLLKTAIIKSTSNAFYVLLGLENQTEIHYAMPVRAMLYDALNYEKQIKEAAKLHKKNKDKMTSAEFLSGFKKTDKLTPIISLTLYWGVDRWDGPTHMHEMFGEIDEKLKPFIPDYYVNLVTPNQIQDFTKFKTELGQVLKFIKYSADAFHFKKMLSELKNKKLTNETVSVINLFTDAEIELNKQEEVTDVCLAIEEIKKEYAAEQVAKEIINSIESAMKNFHVSLEEACKGLKHTVKEYEDAKKFVESLEIV